MASLYDVLRYLRGEARVHRRAAATLSGYADCVESILKEIKEPYDPEDYEAIVNAIWQAIAPRGGEDDD